MPQDFFKLSKRTNKDILTLEMQEIFKNSEKFQLGIWFVLILMLDVSAEHTEENHATFRKFRDFYLIESRKNVRIKTKQEKDFWNFTIFMEDCVFDRYFAKLFQPKSESFKKQVKVCFFHWVMIYLVWGRHWYCNWPNIYFLPFLNLLMNIILEKCTQIARKSALKSA